MIVAFALAFLTADALPLKTESLARTPSTVSTLDERDPVYLFCLTNPGKISYVISRVEASCGCLATTLSSGEGEPAVPAAPLILPVPFAPGESLTVRATVRLSDLRPGHFHKTVTIWGQPAAAPPRNTNDAVALSQAEALARIEMEGTLAQPVLFARESAAQPVSLSHVPVTLGKVSAGGVGSPVRQAADSGEFILRATPDPRLTTAGNAGEMPPLISSHPAVSVTPLADARPASKGDLRTLRYRVRVAPGAPLGPFLANLSFTSVGKGERTGNELRRDRAWRTASLLVVGEIVGDLSASPSLVTFVLIPKGAESADVSTPVAAGAVPSVPDRNLTRRIVLTATRPEVFTGLTIRTDNPLVRATLNPPATTTGSDANRCLLTVTLSPDVYRASFAPPSVALPQGSPFRAVKGAENTLQSQVILTLPNGQRIVLPVSVYRMAPTTLPVVGIGK